MQTIDALHVFDYRVFATRARRRTPAWHVVRETFRMAIPSIERADRMARGGIHHDPDEAFGIFGRRFLVPVRTHASDFLAVEERGVPYERGYRASHDEHVRRFANERNLTFSRSPRPYATTLEEYPVETWHRSLRDSFAGDGSDLREIVESDREERRKLAEVDAGHLLYVDGILHTTRYEPGVVSTLKSEQIQWCDTFDIARTELPVRGMEHVRRHVAEAHEQGFMGAFVGEHLEHLDRLDVEWRFPTLLNQLRTRLRQAIEAVIQINRRSVHVGGGAMAFADVPEDLDEAVFDLRSSFRDISVDIRGGHPSPEVMLLAGERLGRFADVFERKAPLRANHGRKKALDLVDAVRETHATVARYAPTSAEGPRP